MRSVHALLMILAAASVVMSDDANMRHSPDVEDNEIPCALDNESKNDIVASVMATLNEQFQRSSEILQSFFNVAETDDVVRLVVIEEEEKDPVLERKMACLKAVEKIHLLDEMQEETMMLMKYIRSTFDKISLQIWGGASCEDLDRPELVDQCNVVLKSKDVVEKYLREGKTDDQVCDIMSAVTNDISCHLCQSFVQVIDHALSQDMQQVEQVREIIGELCNAMQSDSMCHTFLKNYDAIVNWVKHGTDPLVVCSRLAMCSADNDSHINMSDLAWYSEEPSASEDAALATLDSENPSLCFTCIHASEMITQVMNSLAHDQFQVFKGLLPSVCEMLLPVSKCLEAEASFDVIVELMQISQHPRKFCVNQASVCSKETGLVVSQIRDDDKACAYCDAATTVVEVILQEDPEQMNQLREYADIICNILGEDSPCHEYVGQLDTIIDSLNHGAHPRDICKKLKYCAAEQVNNLFQVNESAHVGMIRGDRLGKYPLASMINQDVDKNAPSIADDAQDVTVTSELLSGSDTQCTYCQFATTVARMAIQQYGADIREIRAYADMICDVLGEDSPCHVYVNQLDFVIDSITKGMSSKAICVGLKFCVATLAKDDENTATSDSSVASLVSNRKAQGHDSMLVRQAKEWLEVPINSCFVCTQAASIIEVAVAEDPSKIPQIRQIAVVFCELLSSGGQCQPFMKKFESVVAHLQEGKQPHAVCRDLQYCTADSDVDMVNLAVPDMIAVQGNDKKSSTCASCNGVVTVIQYALAEKPDKVMEMREVVGMLCQLLAADDTCHSDLEMYDKVVSDLQSRKEPQAICQMLQFCTPVNARGAMLSGLVDITGGDFLPTRCATCQQNALLLASFVTSPDSLATFEQEISSLCRLIPELNECKLLMKHYDTIMDLLKKQEDVETICTQIGECDPVAKEVQEEKSMSVGCLLCEFTADLLEHVKDNDKALREAKVMLETMCTVLPPLARCDTLSSKFDELLSLIREGNSPSEACHAIALCDAKFVVSPTPGMEEDVIMQAFAKARQSVSNTMEIE